MLSSAYAGYDHVMSPDQSAVGGDRQNKFVLAEREKRLLIKMASRIPRRILPDDLTIIGIIAAVAIAVCWGFSNNSRYFLLATPPLLLLHWLGDSLDGTLARVRKITRPRYGYYLDHLTDAFSTIIIGVGIGSSPYLYFSFAAGAIIAYLVLSINVYLEGEVFGRFDIGYGQLGPTEMRLFLAALAVILFAVGPLPVTIFGLSMPVLNLVVAAVIVYMFAALLWRARKSLRSLATDEPPARRS